MISGLEIAEASPPAANTIIYADEFYQWHRDGCQSVEKLQAIKTTPA